jgi:DNA modification methylase
MSSATIQDLHVVYERADSLTAFSNNARTHSRAQTRKIADSIQAFGFTNPVLIDKKSTIIAGHGRVAAAKMLGISQIPTIRLEGLSPDQIRAYIIADNKLAELAGWDNSILKIELQHLITLDSGFDVTITGFEIPEIDLIMQDEAQTGEQEDEMPATTGSPVTQLGDLWLLGKHRILCGSSLDSTSYDRLMNGKKGSVVFTDPPFNVPIDGHVCGNGAIKHEEFAMASGEMNEDQFICFLSDSLRQLERHSKPGSVHFVCMDWRHMKELLLAGEGVYDSLLNLCVWNKDNGGMGSFYRSQHELVFVFRKKGNTHRNNIQLGKYGRNRTNIWKYPGVNTLSKQGDEGNLLALHPTVKPVALVADALLDCSAPKEIVLDAFLGSGTTLLAAERTGRVCYGIELNSKYVDVAIRRWQQQTGQQAVHAQSNKIFDELSQEQDVTRG